MEHFTDYVVIAREWLPLITIGLRDIIVVVRTWKKGRIEIAVVIWKEKKKIGEETRSVVGRLASRIVHRTFIYLSFSNGWTNTDRINEFVHELNTRVIRVGFL